MKDFQIVLGEVWKRFAFYRDDLEYLGTIKRGIEIGALAKDPQGNFLQVNGDIRQALNKSRIEAHLRVLAAQASPRFHQPSSTARAAVTVVIKPRRRCVEPSA